MATLVETTGPLSSGPLTGEEIRKIDAYWRAANYLSVGQIYLYDNPMLSVPLRIEHIKPRLLGHWGTTPGLNLIYAHCNRVINKYDLNMIFVCGPGHGGPGVVANTWLEGTYSELYPNIAQDTQGIQRLFKQFSFPGGIPSHAAPETPGSIHEGGELGYALVHSYGAAFDNPDLLVCCVVGDGEAETGPLATSWHSNKFLNPVRDGAVLPILHLNGYKIAGPTVLARIPKQELSSLFAGYGYQAYFVEGDDPKEVHQSLAAAMDTVVQQIRSIQHDARLHGFTKRPRWPMIVLRTPKGWTGPKKVDGVQIEGTFRAHQVPLDELATKPEHIRMLEAWMKSYRPEELFDKSGRPVKELAELPPKGDRRMSANPHANGGLLLRDLAMPDFRDYAVALPAPGAVKAEASRVLGRMLRDVMKMNEDARNFRIVGPDETNSNRLNAVFEVTNRVSTAEILPTDDHVTPDGRVMEVLSEHMCQGWLEGYLLTGRHGFFSCYEAFVHIIDSMFNQHAKWLSTTRCIPWRRPIASLNYLLTSHVWRQDHNGFSHQDPGFLDHVVNKKASVVRVYLPPDANCLLSVGDHCLRSRHYVNVIVAGKNFEAVWLDIDAAVEHCTNGIGIWNWASNDQGTEPDAVMACAGDVPTLETMAAVDLLRKNVPDIKIRVVNIVDLMTLQPSTEHPHGLSDRDFDSIFTNDKPVVFAFHGYPWLIHRLTYRRTNHANMHVRGYKEEGTTTTPFDMTVRNELDRYHLAIDVIDRVPRLHDIAAHQKQAFRNKLVEHKLYIDKYGDDMPEIKNWQWPWHMKILAINVGSSTIKCWFGESDSPDKVTEIKRVQADVASVEDVASALPKALEPLWQLSGGPQHLDAVAHRIVHAGPDYRRTAWLAREVRDAIAANAEFAPAHNRLELAAIAAMDRVLPDPSRQVAVFDTGFHSTLPPEAYVYPGPYEWLERGIRRFGFHGINHAHVSRRAPEILGRPSESLRIISCHLGNGCSLAAIAQGKSADTTMGFTPADGLMMGSRCGSLDPGIIVYLLRHGGYTADQLDQIFNRESGLKGISGISGDMREILESVAAGNPRARLAFDIFAHRLTRETGAMLAVLGGLDALIFTGGIGEHCAPLRERLCAQLAFLGLRLDSDKNQHPQSDTDISAADSAVRVLVIGADEELEMARECTRLAGAERC